MQIKLYGDTVTVHSLTLSKYMNNDAMAVVAQVEYADGLKENLAISVNVNGVSEHLDEGLFAAKNYSEREEMYRELVEAKWIVPTGEVVPSGYVAAPICRVGDAAVVLELKDKPD